MSYDAANRPVSVDDGRGKTEISYNRSGYPVTVKNPFGLTTRICYNAFNAPVNVTDANGIVTDYSYNDAGCVTRIVRKDGSEVLSSAGPVSLKGISFLNDMLGTTVGAKSDVAGVLLDIT